MSALSFDQALGALLLATRTPGALPPQASIEQAMEYLAGQGVRLQRLALLHPAMPDEEDQLGCVVVTAAGFIPVLGGGAEAILLNAEGAALRLIGAEDMAGAGECFLLIEHATNLARMAPFFQRHRGKLVEVLACGVLINLFALTLPLFSSFVYDKVLGNGITATLWALLIGLLIVMVVEFSMRVIRIIITERVARFSEAEIDHTVLQNLLDAKANAMPSVGSVLEKYKQILYYRDFLSSAYLLALADLPFLLMFIVAILIVAGPLVLVGIACGVLMIAANALFMLPVFDYERKARRASEQRLLVITDVLASRDAVVGATLRHALSRKWHAASLSAAHALSMGRFWRGISQTTNNALSFLSYAGVLVVGVYMVEAQTLTSGGLLAASMLTSRMIGNFTSVSTLLVRYREFRTAMQEMNKIFPAGIKERPRAVHGHLKGAVRFDRVTCRLGHGGHAVLQDVSFQIRPGEMVGIAGAPGGGKTTVLRMIAGLLEPEDGQVLIDHIPITALSLEDISSAIGFKPQDLCLMDGTIEENIRAGRPPLDSAMREALLEVTGLGRAFQENGLSWATPIGARGAHLSGGQRQLVALARALAGHPALLLLDEPTNGLDAATEAHLADQFQRMKGKATILISTHSRSLLSICDRIIVVGQSRILADGPREKILA